MWGKQSRYTRIRTLSHWTKKEFPRCRNWSQSTAEGNHCPHSSSLSPSKIFPLREQVSVSSTKEIPSWIHNPESSTPWASQCHTPAWAPYQAQSKVSPNKFPPPIPEMLPYPTPSTTCIWHSHKSEQQAQWKWGEWTFLMYPLPKQNCLFQQSCTFYQATLPRLIPGLCSLFGWLVSCSALSTDFRRVAVFPPFRAESPAKITKVTLRMDLHGERLHSTSPAQGSITLFFLIGTQEATMWTCQEPDLALSIRWYLSWSVPWSTLLYKKIPLIKLRARQNQEKVKLEEETRRKENINLALLLNKELKP